MMNFSGKTALVLFLAMGASAAWADPDAAERAAFQRADNRPWQVVCTDEGTDDWTQQWFLTSKENRRNS